MTNKDEYAVIYSPGNGYEGNYRFDIDNDKLVTKHDLDVRVKDKYDEWLKIMGVGN